MQELTDSLKTRYEIALQSSSDPDFYQNVHHYYDLIEKTPELENLVREDQLIYADKHGNTWNNPNLTAEEKRELTTRIERFSLYASSASISVGIYEPIEDYKNSVEPEDQQDLRALLMIRGINGIHSKKWNHKELKQCNRHYEGQRKYYEKELRQFHLLMLAAIESAQKLKPKKTETKQSPLEISFNREKSILNFFGTEVPLSLKVDKTDAHYLLLHLLSAPSEKHYYSELPNEVFGGEYKWRKPYNAATGIKSKIAKKTTNDDFLIIKTGESGYTQINPIYLDKLQLQ